MFHFYISDEAMGMRVVGQSKLHNHISAIHLDRQPSIRPVRVELRNRDS